MKEKLIEYLNTALTLDHAVILQDKKVKEAVEVFIKIHELDLYLERLSQLGEDKEIMRSIQDKQKMLYNLNNISNFIKKGMNEKETKEQKDLNNNEN